MSTWLVIGVTVAYVFTSIDLALHNNFALSFVFFGYSVANVGMVFLTR